MNKFYCDAHNSLPVKYSMNNSTTVFVTYCSAKKNHQSDLMPAVERYQSKRIRQIYSAARSLNIDCYILSGKYGIIGTCDLIPDYDYMLVSEDVTKCSQKIEKQLKTFKIEQIIFFMRPLTEDENVKPYMELIKLTCKKNDISLTIVNLTEQLLQYD